MHVLGFLNKYFFSCDENSICDAVHVTVCIQQVGLYGPTTRIDKSSKRMTSRLDKILEGILKILFTFQRNQSVLKV